MLFHRNQPLKMNWNELQKFLSQFGVKVSPSSSLLLEVIEEFAVSTPSDDFLRAEWRGASLIQDILVDMICRDSRLNGEQRDALLEQLMDDRTLARLVMTFNALSVFPSVTLSPAELEASELSRFLKALCGALALELGRERAASFIELIYLDEFDSLIDQAILE